MGLAGRRQAMKIEFYSLEELPVQVGEAWEQQVRERLGLLPLTLSIDWLKGITAERPDDAVMVVLPPACWSGKGWVLPLLLSSQSLPCRIGPLRCARPTIPIAKVFGGDCSFELLEQGQFPLFLGAVLSRYPRLQGIMFDHVPQGARSDIIKKVARKAGYGTGIVFEGIPHYRIILPPTYGEFRALRTGDSLKKIRKHERQLTERVGVPCRLMEFHLPDDWEPFIEPLEQLAASCWQARYLEHGLDLKELGRLASFGWVRLFILAAGEKFVAFVLCYQGKDSLIREQSGYDPIYANFYPGEVLLYKMMERLYETERPAVIDFGVGEGYHKRMVANDVTMVDSILVLRSGIINRFRWSLYTACRSADRMMRNATDRIGIKKQLARYLKRKM